MSFWLSSSSLISPRSRDADSTRAQQRLPAWSGSHMRDLATRRIRTMREADGMTLPEM
jgi:hypothetical protein